MKTESTVPETLSWQFTYLGFACLFGWNVVLNVSFPALLDDRVFTVELDNLLSTVYGLAMAVAILPLIFIGADVIPKNPRASFGGACMFASLGLIGLCGFIKPASVVFGCLLVSLLGIGTALVQGFYFSEAAMTSGPSIGKFSLGQAIAGLIILPIMITLKSIFTDYLHVMSAFAFIAAIACAGSIPVYVFSVRKHLAMKEATAALNEPTSTSEKPRAYLAIIKDIWPMTLCIFLNFVLLFVVFPGHLITRKSYKWSSSGYISTGSVVDYTTVAFFIYNLSDCVGRYLVGVGVTLNRAGVLAVTASRLAPLTLWYVATFSGVSLFSDDLVRFAIMAIHTMMQGLAVTWAFILAPAKITIAAEQPIVGNMNTLALVLGIMTGAALGGPIDSIFAQ